MAKEPKKTTTRKSTARKTTAKKPVAKKKPVRKAAAKKAAAKQAPAQPVMAENEGIHPAAKPFLWLGSKFVQRNFMWLVLMLAVGFMSVDLFHHRHGHFQFETWFAFYAFFGFASFVFVVLSGWPLRWLTGRPENYYDDEEGSGE